ncbi:hypothetical protein [Paraburkholderia sp. Ac-20347]|uniref:hypothetical protein n=1 Tax=Paraburkholderia sp. Ac-20347 TaxID=2703892 RepID=UPI00197D1F1D|nr:hypothetical protein [Paraburkholderia sp. Ac-20347]MBN3811716.1 hypothetical protein [Paraburkholderia sp. Ac-20347]
MNSTPINTAIAVGSGALVAPVIDQIATGLHLSLTPDVRNAIIVLVVAGAHWIGHRYSASKTAPTAQP